MFERSVVVRLGHTDAAGVLYFAEQLRLCHEVYEALLDDAALPVRDILRGEPWALPIVRAEADLERPVFVGDRLSISITLARAGETSFTLDYTLTRDGTRVGRARTVHVCVDKSAGDKTLLPVELITALQQRVGEGQPDGA